MTGSEYRIGHGADAWRRYHRRMRITALLLACCWLAACTHARPLTAPATVILVSVDGLPAATVGSGVMPTLDAIAASGTRAEGLVPSYPTHTFPNHYTLVTGLRPDRHGIVHNSMRDAGLGRFVSKNPASASDGRWWGGEPIWATLQKQGGIAATMFWPGSEAEIGGQRPRYFQRFDGSLGVAARVDQVLAWLDLPPAQRPQLLTLYMERYDVAAHAGGMQSPQARAALQAIDAALARLRDGLHQRGLAASTNLIVLSDHGMADVRGADVHYLDDVVALEAVRIEYAGAMTGLTPVPGQETTVEAALLGRHDRYQCWRKSELPAAWQYGRNPRIPAIVCQADVGWRLWTRGMPALAALKGEHGYAPESPLMHGVFVASGPAFVAGGRIPAFDNVDVYPLLARLLQITPAANDGDIRPLLPALLERAR